MTIKINDGGQAFPSEGEGHGNPHYHSPGMTLFDWFAGQCLPGAPALSLHPGEVAQQAYAVAEAMMEERARLGIGGAAADPVAVKPLLFISEHSIDEMQRGDGWSPALIAPRASDFGDFGDIDRIIPLYAAPPASPTDEMVASQDLDAQALDLTKRIEREFYHDHPGGSVQVRAKVQSIIRAALLAVLGGPHD